MDIKSKSVIKKITCSICILILILIGYSISFGADAPRPKFYYFNPDSSEGNFGRLKREMDSFFSHARLKMSFQPFKHLHEFDRILKENRPAFVFMPQWYLFTYGHGLDLHPFLVPTRNGRSTYNKVLLVSMDSDINIENMKNKTLALTTMGPNATSILNDILFKDKKNDGTFVNTLIVNNDKDALFAVTLGHVDMALVVKDNMEHIFKLNPHLEKSVRIIMESEPVSMPVLCYWKGVAATEEINKLRKIFIGNSQNKFREKIMAMLQIDAWENIASGQGKEGNLRER